MDAKAFFEVIEEQYKKQLPFVVYSRPINSIIKCWLQNDAELHSTSAFTESGFVFSPFNFEKSAIVFPDDKSTHLSIEAYNLEAKKGSEIHLTPKEELKTTHIRLIEKGIEKIKANQFKKIVLSRRFSVTIFNQEPLQIFKRLFNTYKNAMVYCWYHPKVGLWLGATPELLFKVEGLNITTISLAGTKPYTEKNSDQWTSKEREEQEIVTDFIIEQLNPLSKNIKVSDVETIRAGSLVHLKTKIEARLESVNSNLSAIIRALHPTPAVCGFPRKESQEFIRNNEHYDRDFYTGFLGELNITMTNSRNTNKRNVENNAYKTVRKQSNFYVNLRCMQLGKHEAVLYVGGGITKDSRAEMEWEETVEKSKTMLKVL